MGDPDSQYSRDLLLSLPDEEGLTPLFKCAVIGDLAGAIKLLKSDVSPIDVGCPYTGETPLDEAIKRGYVDMVVAMLAMLAKSSDGIRLPLLESSWLGGKVVELPSLLVDLYGNRTNSQEAWRDIQSIIDTHLRRPVERKKFSSIIARIFATLLRTLRLSVSM